MKKISNLILLLLCVILTRCTEPTVEPATLTEDLTTSANLYEDQFLTLAITTVRLRPEEPLPEQVGFYLDGNGGKISVNWGDGTIEKRIVDPSEMNNFSHQYKQFRKYTITISGDIKTITYFDMNFQVNHINKIHFGGLVNLESVNMYLNSVTPAVINLSRNRNLRTLIVAEQSTTEDVLFPSNNKLTNVNISGQSLMTRAAVDRVIARIHDSVINNPRSGYFHLGVFSGQDSEYVGPPSYYSINKLRKLRDVYGWTIYPDLK